MYSLTIFAAILALEVFVIASRKLPKECPAVICMECPEGYQVEEPHKDENGCDVSSCACVPEYLKEPADLCPNAPKNCPLGCQEQIKDGCLHCDCLQESTICNPKIDCLLDCPFGYEEDSTGCQTCKCKSICPTLTCDLKCSNGFQLDAFGCEMCQCRSICPTLTCDLKCSNGFQLDAYGCPICKCNPLMTVCPFIMCEHFCSNGYEKDENGCPTCKCKSSSNMIMSYGDVARGKRKG